MENAETSFETRLDEALFALPEESLGNVGSALGRTRLRTFIMLRWFAVIGQTLAILVVAFGLNFDVNLSLCLGIIAASAWLNVALTFAFPTQRLAREGEAFAQLCFDTVQLSLLLAATGGLSQPFLFFLIAPVTIAAASLRPIYAILLASIAVGLAAMMPLFSAPLPWLAGQTLELPQMYQWGHFSAMVVGIAFFTFSAIRVNNDEARLVRALDAAQVVMAREQRLSALGAMAAMTAHELGTPLATIHLVAREMSNEMADDSPLREDAALLAEQAERCRNILQNLAQQREAGDIVHANMPLSSLVEEAAAPHRGLGVTVDVRTQRGDSAEDKMPILKRSPEILHALSAFIENAVSFAESEVRIMAVWNAADYVITVRDDGPGFSAEVLPRLGEPYVSERGEAQIGGGDMGLGFFIAKTLVERTGGRIATQNRPPPAQGAIVQATWPRVALESDPENTI